MTKTELIKEKIESLKIQLQPLIEAYDWLPKRKEKADSIREEIKKLEEQLSNISLITNTPKPVEDNIPKKRVLSSKGWM